MGTWCQYITFVYASCSLFIIGGYAVIKILILFYFGAQNVEKCACVCVFVASTNQYQLEICCKRHKIALEMRCNIELTAIMHVAQSYIHRFTHTHSETTRVWCICDDGDCASQQSTVWSAAWAFVMRNIRKAPTMYRIQSSVCVFIPVHTHVHTATLRVCHRQHQWHHRIVFAVAEKKNNR